VNELKLVPASRSEPFTNVGLDGVSDYLDFQVDGVALLRRVEELIEEHQDVVTALTEEYPHDAVALLEVLLGIDATFSIGFGAEEGEAPLYVCPLDQDPLCGGIVAKVTRTAQTVRWWDFRYTHWDLETVDEVTARLATLDFTFGRGQFDGLLEPTRGRFVELASSWAPPDHALGTLRLALRRLKQLASRLRGL
jgi:hypothetical protein